MGQKLLEYEEKNDSYLEHHRGFFFFEKTRDSNQRIGFRTAVLTTSTVNVTETQAASSSSQATTSSLTV